MPLDEATLSTLKSLPTPFYDGDYGEGFLPLPIVELGVLKIMTVIRNKKDWHLKVNNPEIKAKWQTEVQGQPLTIKDIVIHLSDEELGYIFDELRYLANIYPDYPPSGVEGTFGKDDYVPEQVHSQLLKYVEQLENVPEHKKDWHPASDNLVLDLVHPSLFCYVNERSLVLNPVSRVQPEWSNFVGSGAPVKLDFNYLWVPSEFTVLDRKTKIASYINNLHPEKYAGLYTTIASIFDLFLPLFENVLMDLAVTKKPRIEVNMYDLYSQDESEPDYDDYDLNDQSYDNAMDEWQAQRQFKDIKLPPFKLPTDPRPVVDLSNADLQVIVKFANIHLTPSKPTYNGGVWHIEGTENEKICATGIYYYDVENISDSYLRFRKNVCEPSYEQNEHAGVANVYGFEDNAPLNQEIGAIKIENGRCIAFPNMFQHKVEPFELLDKSKPGHRKIMCFFLVKPDQVILSTASVSPQQQSWYSEEVQKVKSRLSELPELVRMNIDKYSGWPMSLKEAKEHRLKLMEERKFYVNERNELLFERQISLCEH